MKPVRLPFETQPATMQSRLFGRAPGKSTPLAFCMMTVALACGTAMAWQVWRAGEELAHARVSLLALQTQTGQPIAQAAEFAQPQMTAQQRQAWSQVARQLNTPWAALLDALEAVTPDDVALVSIEPDARVGSVRMQVESRTLDPLLAYAGELGALALFERVDLAKHETNEQDANRPLRLSLDLRLRSPEVRKPGRGLTP